MYDTEFYTPANERNVVTTCYPCAMRASGTYISRLENRPTFHNSSFSAQILNNSLFVLPVSIKLLYSKVAPESKPRQPLGHYKYVQVEVHLRDVPVMIKTC